MVSWRMQVSHIMLPWPGRQEACVTAEIALLHKWHPKERPCQQHIPPREGGWLSPRKNGERRSCYKQVFIELGIWTLVKFYKRSKTEGMQQRWIPWPAAMVQTILRKAKPLQPFAKVKAWSVCLRVHMKSKETELCLGDQYKLLLFSNWIKYRSRAQL